MKKLLNTLYVTSENSYLSLDGENIVVFEDKKRLAGSLYIIWKELFLLDTEEQARRLWEPVLTEIFLYAMSLRRENFWQE